MSYEIKPCDYCAYEGERYYSGTTCRYCGKKDKFIFDLTEEEIKECQDFKEYEEEGE